MEGNEHFTKMIRSNMESDAWSALSAHAQALYPWIKLEWRGPHANNNGRIQLSVRQAAQRIGCNPDTAAKAFRDLQGKGWLIVTTKAVLGVEGKARAHEYELTEIAMPHGLGKSSPVKGNPVPRNLFRKWREGNDFPIADIRTNNPKGRNGIQNPVPKNRTSRPTDWDEQIGHVPKIGTGRPTDWDEQSVIDHADVPRIRTPLYLPGGSASEQPSLSRKFYGSNAGGTFEPIAIFTAKVVQHPAACALQSKYVGQSDDIKVAS